jgi:hypothetical protein
MRPLLRRPPALLLFLAAVAIPACNGTGNPTIPNINRSALTVTVEPNPVIGSLNALTGVVNVNFTVKIQETAGLGGEVVSLSAQIFDPTTGAPVALTYYDSADMLVFAGTKTLAAAGSISVALNSTYTLADKTAPATMTVTVQVKDDRANLVIQSLLVKIQ